MQSTTRSGARPRRSPTARVMRALAWWYTKRSMSARPSSASAHASSVLSESRATAALKVSWPRIRTRRSSLPAQMQSPPEPSERSSMGPIAPGAPAVTSAAPAPSPNSAAVRRSSSSTTRLISSAPITSTACALPVSTWAAAIERPDRKPVHAAPRSTAPACPVPSRSATRGAALGSSSSWVKVATSTRSTSEAGTPPASSASAPARVARAVRPSPSAARRRSRTPVRLTIQSSSTPSRPAIAALGTTSCGRATPRPAMPAVRARGAPRGSARGASVAIELCISDLPALGGQRLHIIERAPHESRQHTPWSGLHHVAHAHRLQLAHHVEPAHWADERLSEAPAGVPEGLSRDAREHGHLRPVEVDCLQQCPEPLGRARHRGGMERPRHREALGANAARAGFFLGGCDPVLGTGDHHLVWGVLVRHHQSVALGERLGVGPRRPDGHHAAAGARLGHQAPALGHHRHPVVLAECPGGHERGHLAKRVPGEEVGIGAAEPLEARQAGAEDRGLVEAGVLTEARERVLAHRVHGELEQVRAPPFGELSHVCAQASLAREDDRAESVFAHTWGLLGPRGGGTGSSVQPPGRGVTRRRSGG